MDTFTLDLDNLIIPPRQRKTYARIDDLAASIERFGQFVPIIVTPIPEEKGKYLLVMGGRRIRALQKLGLTTALAMEKETLDKVHRLELELEENLQREDLSWPERAEAIAEIHRLKTELYGPGTPGRGKSQGWSQQDTATATDLSTGLVSESLLAADVIKHFPELAKEKSVGAAIRKYKWLRRKAGDIIQAQSLEDPETLHPNAHLCHGDAFSYMKPVESHSFDLILTDPPWGIDLDQMHMLASDDRGAIRVDKQSISDNSEWGKPQLEELISQAARLLAPDRWFVMFIGDQHLNWITQTCAKYFPLTNPVPGIWDKVNPGRPGPLHLSPQHEMFIYCCTGKRNISPHSTIFPCPRVSPSTQFHPTQKPIALMQELIEVFSLKHERVFDPFMGSGSTIAACVRAGRQGTGCELDETYFKRASVLVHDVTKEVIGDNPL